MAKSCKPTKSEQGRQLIQAVAQVCRVHGVKLGFEDRTLLNVGRRKRK
jgi:hypothetical protein